jgi:hypothetical protein
VTASGPGPKPARERWAEWKAQDQTRLTLGGLGHDYTVVDSRKLRGPEPSQSLVVDHWWSASPASSPCTTCPADVPGPPSGQCPVGLAAREECAGADRGAGLRGPRSLEDAGAPKPVEAKVEPIPVLPDATFWVPMPMS